MADGRLLSEPADRYDLFFRTVAHLMSRVLDELGSAHQREQAEGECRNEPGRPSAMCYGDACLNLKPKEPCRNKSRKCCSV